MNSGVSKARIRRSRVKLSKALQETLLNVFASNTAGTEFPRSHREQSPKSGDLAGDATPVQAGKRRLDATTESNPVPAKRARLTRTDSQPPGVEEEEVEQTTLRQPKPSPPRRPYALFLKDFVDPVHPSRRPASVHTLVSEWLESVGSDREKHCRSDSHLHHSEDDLVPRQLTRSAPEMGYTKDADGFAVPPTPAFTGSRSYRADADAGSVAPSDLTGATSGSGRSGRSLVEDPLYRDMNLAANNIYMRPLREQFPESIADLVDYMRRDRDSPGPSSDQVWQDTELNELWMGTGEPEVEDYFKSKIFPKPGPSDSLKRSDRQPMAKHTVPSTGSKLKVSTPVPDMLYGYSRKDAFPQQQGQLISMGTEMVANSQGLIYPFFVIEFKGDGPSGAGSLWVATNQCLGASSSCVAIAERLNHQLRHCKNDVIQPINSAAFSIAMSGTEARLYISWKHNELGYYMANVENFLLQKPKDYLEFRKHVRNIIDWGGDGRLKEIRDSLDSLLEESRLRASEAVKSRQPPSGGSATSSGKKHKSSSLHRNSSGSTTVQEPNGRADEPYRVPDETTSRGANAEPSFLSHPQQRFTDDDYTRQYIGQAPPAYFSPEPDQNQAPWPSGSAAEPASFATNTSGFTPGFGARYHEDSLGSPSYPQEIHGSAEDGIGYGTSHAAAESFASPNTAEEPKAATDDYWIWSKGHKNWYHLGDDGSRTWYKKRGNRK